MKTIPKLTVLMPTYNGAQFLDDSINSLLTQSFNDFELLIVDDGSTDNTKEIVSKYLNDNRINYIYKANSGTGNTLNYGIKLVKTKYIIRMDDDDISHPNRLEKLYSFMEEHPEVVACGSSIAYFMHDLHKENIYTCTLPTENESIVSGLLNLAHVFCHASFIFRTDAALKIGGFEIPGIGEDWDFTLQLSKEGQLRNLNEVLYYVRLNPTSVTSTRFVECLVNNKFSISRYKNNWAASKLESFQKEHAKAYFYNTLLEMDNRSLALYRRGVKYYLVNKKIGYYFFIFLAGLASPSNVWNRLSRIYTTTYQQR